MPYCDCCLPAVHKEDDDAVELLIQAATDTLVWSEATCAQPAPAADLGPAIANWSDRRRGDTVGDGSNKALVDLVSEHKTDSVHPPGFSAVFREHLRKFLLSACA